MKNMKIKHLNAKSEQFIDKSYVTATNVHNQVTDKHQYQFKTIGQHNNTVVKEIRSEAFCNLPVQAN